MLVVLAGLQGGEGEPDNLQVFVVVYRKHAPCFFV